MIQKTQSFPTNWVDNYLKVLLQQKNFISIVGVGHNDLFTVQQTFSALQDFLRQE